MDPMHFIVATLVVWRLTHLLGKEDGPFDLIFLLRQKAGAGFFGSLLDCFYCLSIWVALPFGFGLSAGWKEGGLYWLALSGAASLLEKVTDRDDHISSPPPYTEDKN